MWKLMANRNKHSSMSKPIESRMTGTLFATRSSRRIAACSFSPTLAVTAATTAYTLEIMLSRLQVEATRKWLWATLERSWTCVYVFLDEAIPLQILQLSLFLFGNECGRYNVRSGPARATLELMVISDAFASTALLERMSTHYKSIFKTYYWLMLALPWHRHEQHHSQRPPTKHFQLLPANKL